MPCFVSIGLICQACSLGLVHFTGETLSVSCQKFCSTVGPDLMRLGASHFTSSVCARTKHAEMAYGDL